jgi:hypothetical protein
LSSPVTGYFWFEEQRLSEPKRLDGIISSHDLEGDEAALGFLENNLARRANRVTDAVERNLEHVTTGVEDDAKQRQPTRFDTVADVERRDVKLDPPAGDLS